MTTYRDQFYRLDPQTATAGTTLTVEKIDLIDQSTYNAGDGSVTQGTPDGIINLGDSVVVTKTDSNGDPVTYTHTITGIYNGDSIVVEINGSDVTYTGTTIFYEDENGEQQAIFTPVGAANNPDPAVLQDGIFQGATYATMPTDTFAATALGPPCFVKGTLIDTPSGQVRVEDLKPGDLVETVDCGPMPLLAVSHRELDGATLDQCESWRPICIRQGALGSGMPLRDTYLSPQHRVLLRSPIVERMFDAHEVLAPAAQLTLVDGIDQAPLESVIYYHLVFAEHQVIYAEGTPMESLLLGARAADIFDPEELAALNAQCGREGNQPVSPARVLVKGPKLNSCISRHVKNGVALLEPSGASSHHDAA